MIKGIRYAPVVLTRYQDSPAAPYSASNLQKDLFDGPWPTGTMTDYYRAMSDHNFTVTGTVFDWKQLGKNHADYEGPDYMDAQGNLQPCYGLCDYTRLLGFIKDSLDQANLDWSQYDNDGPDGIPNSGDDNGYVDFVAIVHAGTGGECRGSKGIWSHRWRLSGIPGGSEYVTRTPAKGGGFLKIDDYVIVPALACDASTMIQIGVFTHEFGHVFGLPDLYDTDPTNGRSEGIGNWCLMAGGSWGGDGHSPERPSMLSPWALDFLGWAHVQDIIADQNSVPVPPFEDTHQVLRVRTSPSSYYLVNNIQQKGYNTRLPGAGIAVWRIDETVLIGGLRNNRVNADAAHKGVQLEEADGLRRMDGSNGFRGDAADLFPGPGKQWRAFDNGTRPPSVGAFALCGISDSADTMTAGFLVSRGACATANTTGPPTDQAGMPPSGSAVPAAGEVSITAVLTDPQKWMGKDVHIVGTITNTAANFFDPGQRLVLKDASGVAIDVKVGLPSAVLPSPTGSIPSALPSILGKHLDVIGVVEKDAGKPGGTVLNIKRVQVAQ
jgi:M6 family metalloprotease-like protein